MTRRASRARRATSAAALALAAVLTTSLAACSGGADGLDQAALEEAIADGRDGAEVACDGGLAEEVDAAQVCRVTEGEQTAEVRVTTTAISDGEPEFEVVPFVSAERAAEEISSSLADQGLSLDSVECEDDLPGEVGATTTCLLSRNEFNIPEVTAEVTAVDGLFIDFTFGTVSPGE